MHEPTSSKPNPSAVPMAPPSLDRLLDDQEQRWRRGERVLIEDYLGQNFGLGQDADAVLDLIYNEALLREARGEAPQPDEYERRFPGLAAAIRRLFEVHHAVEGGTPDSVPEPVGDE